MTPDRKRDATVYLAEHVMGWTPRRDREGVSYFDADDERRLYVWNKPPSYMMQIEFWRPFDDIADAWMLVEALSRRGLCVELTMDPPPFSRAHCVLSAHCDVASCPGGFSSAATMPEAICLVALEVARQGGK